MTIIASSVPGLLGGVSQQPASVRFPNQAEACDNTLASVVDGLIKRPPTEHIAEIYDGDPGEVMVHTIDRGVGERYAVLLRDEDVRVYDLTDGTEIQVYDADGNVATSADFSYLDSSSPISDFRAVTVADYTFVLNSQKIPALGAATNPDAEEQAFIFVQQSAYEVEYNLTYQSSGQSTPTTRNLTTWDGNTSDKVAEVRQITVSAAASGTWSGSVLGTSWSAVGTTSLSGLVARIEAALDAVQGVSAVSDGAAGTVDVTCDHPGLDQRLVLNAAPASGSWSQSTITDDSGTQWENIKTNALASEFASMIDTSPLPGWTATAADSTVKMEPTGTDTIDFVRAGDSVGDTYLNIVYDRVDSITALPLTCQDGHIIQVTGDKSANQDDYYLKFAADKAGTFGPGQWEECAAPGIPTGLDASTMPHALVRKIDGNGDKYFEWAPFDWTDRIAGDEETNPSPTFVGKPLRGIFLHQNRLGLLADQNVLMSETGLYGNFWRTTVLTLVDSDPIDVGVGHTRVSLLNHAVPFNQRLYLFSDRTQFVINQTPMTPANTTVVTTAEYENSSTVGGVPSGSSIFFAFKTENYGRILELYPTGETPTSVEVIDSTKHVPRYMPGEITSMSGSTTESLLVATASGYPNVLFVHSYFEQGKQRVQSAWQRFIFGADTEILSADFIEEVLYLVIRRTSDDAAGVFVEKMVFGSGIVDTDSDFRVTLDRRVDETECTNVSYNPDTDQTTVILPYDLDDNQNYQVVSRAVNGKKDAFNLFEDPEDFSTGSAWTSTIALVDANTTEAPDGEITADSVSSEGSASAHIEQNLDISPATDDHYTFSVHVKRDLSSVPSKFVVKLLSTSDITIESIEFSMDTSTGKLTITSSTSAGPLGGYSADVLMITLEDGWWRVSATLRHFGASVGHKARMSIYPAQSAVDKTVILWGAQLLKNNGVEDYSRKAGIIYNSTGSGSNWVTVNGNLATTPFWVGEEYLMKYQFSELNLKEQAASRRGKGVVADAQYYLRHGTIMFDNTGYFRIVVKPKYREATSHPFTSTVFGKPPGLQDGKERFSAIGKAEDITVFIENDSPLPSNLLGIEWTALYNSKSARYSI